MKYHYLTNSLFSRNILEDLMSLLGHGGEISVVAVGAINNLALSDKYDFGPPINLHFSEFIWLKATKSQSGILMVIQLAHI